MPTEEVKKENQEQIAEGPVVEWVDEAELEGEQEQAVAYEQLTDPDEGSKPDETKDLLNQWVQYGQHQEAENRRLKERLEILEKMLPANATKPEPVVDPFEQVYTDENQRAALKPFLDVIERRAEQRYANRIEALEAKIKAQEAQAYETVKERKFRELTEANDAVSEQLFGKPGIIKAGAVAEVLAKNPSLTMRDAAMRVGKETLEVLRNAGFVRARARADAPPKLPGGSPRMVVRKPPDNFDELDAVLDAAAEIVGLT